MNLMFTYDRVTLPFENTAVNRITTLFREGLLTQDLVDILPPDQGPATLLPGRQWHRRTYLRTPFGLWDSGAKPA